MKNNHGKPAKLVLIEWLDSSQPIPGWQWVEDIGQLHALKCQSVGWLVYDSTEVKGIAPNVGGTCDENQQVSGLMKIPTSCIVKITKLSY